MHLVTHTTESADALELRVTATPTLGLTVEEQALEVFTGIRDALAASGAHLFQERVLAASTALNLVSRVRNQAYGAIDDGVLPSLLMIPEDRGAEFAGVQVDAIRTDRRCSVLRCGGTAARIVEANGLRYLSASGTPRTCAETPSAQVRCLLEEAESLLTEAEMDLQCIARTWFWLSDILSWYPEFNEVRTGFYTAHGLISGGPQNCCLPASTGIGVSRPDRAACGLDLIAISGDVRCLQHLPAAGNQDSPFHYGSAFSRATMAAAPCGESVFVSGTASIAPDGSSTHVGDIEAQIAATVANVRGVLRDTNCVDGDVVQAIAYCKTAEVMRSWLDHCGKPDWPCISVIADVCRDDLLFELEATASRKSLR